MTEYQQLSPFCLRRLSCFISSFCLFYIFRAVRFLWPLPSLFFIWVTVCLITDLEILYVVKVFLVDSYLVFSVLEVCADVKLCKAFFLFTFYKCCWPFCWPWESPSSSHAPFFPLATPLSMSASLSIRSDWAARRPCQMTVTAVFTVCN